MLFLLSAWTPVKEYEANFIKLYKAKNRFLFCLDLVPLEAGSSSAFRTCGVTRDDYTGVLEGPANRICIPGVSGLRS